MNVPFDRDNRTAIELILVGVSLFGYQGLAQCVSCAPKTDGVPVQSLINGSNRLMA